MDFSWLTEGITDEVPRTTGPECINYMTVRRRLIEAVIFSIICLIVIRKCARRLDPIVVPPPDEINKPHTAVRLLLLIAMTFIFGVEIGFKFAGKSVIFIMNPCHIQTMVQIYLLASKPNKVSIALFRIQMSNLNGPVLAFLFPEVDHRDLPFEQATYWIQHALLYIIPVYMLRSCAYYIEDKKDFNWVWIGTMNMLLYHFVFLTPLSILFGINLSHQLCAAVSDPFQGQNYRIAAVIHQSILCPILNKGTVLLFSRSNSSNNSSSSSNKLNRIDKTPLIKQQNVNFAGIGVNNANDSSIDQFPYRQRMNEQLLNPSDSILKHRRHSMEYIYVAPQKMSAAEPIEGEYMATTTTTVMPTTKID